MKAAEFEYARARDVAEVCRLLAAAAGDGKIIAGGQTLVPLLVMRLARPALIVDIGGIAELAGIAADADTLTIQAGTRQADALADQTLRARLPLLAKALSFVGHSQTRNRGTIGGSLANADPAAEICLTALTLAAEISATSSDGARKIPAKAFFQSAMTTALSAEECLTAITFPLWDAPRTGTGFQELSARQSDFALSAAAVQLTLDADGVCRRMALGIGGIEATPVRAEDAEKRLIGTRLEKADVESALIALNDVLAPRDDMYASADYRRRVSAALAARAIDEAKLEALRGSAR